MHLHVLLFFDAFCGKYFEVRTCFFHPKGGDSCLVSIKKPFVHVSVSNLPNDTLQEVLGTPYNVLME